MGFERVVPNLTVPDRAALEQGLEVVHPLTGEPWAVTRFFCRNAAGSVINVGAHT